MRNAVAGVLAFNGLPVPVAQDAMNINPPAPIS